MIKQNIKTRFIKIYSEKFDLESLMAFYDECMVLKKNPKTEIEIIERWLKWFVYDLISKKHFFYDFTNLEKRVIVEYHGERFHPNPKVLTEKEMLDWKHLYTKDSSDRVLQKDRYKRYIAEQNLFKYFEIYSNDSQETIDLVISQIKESIV